MLSSVTTFTLDGISARPVRVEVDVHRGLPGFAVVGLPDAAVREARERVRAALVNCGFEFPLSRIVVNLAPASLRKAGPGMDLAIAAALLCASGELEWEGMDRVAFAGELALDGQVRSIHGALAIAEAAREDGARAIVVPAENGPEAALAGPVEILPVHHLGELRAIAAGHGPRPSRPMRLPTGPAGGPDLSDLRGRTHLRYPLEVSAAGGHGLLLVGPPGSGRSMIASRIPSILPGLTRAEALDVVRIAGASGRRGPDLPTGRPFRAAHHTINAAELLGGGIPARPGEVTKAHHGVLFLDDLCAFRREALEALRAPLETGEVSIARASGRRRLPARFMLVAGSDPCPCGAVAKDCVCRPRERARFGARMARAVCGHLPIRLEVGPPTPEDSAGAPWACSAAVRRRVERARGRAEARLGAGRTNAEMTAEEVRGVPLTSRAVRLLAADRARCPIPRPAADQTIRVARTVADLAERDLVGESEMRLALRICGDWRLEAST